MDVAQLVLLRLVNSHGCPDTDLSGAPAFLRHSHQTLSYDACKLHTDVMGKGIESKCVLTLGCARTQVPACRLEVSNSLHISMLLNYSPA